METRYSIQNQLCALTALAAAVVVVRAGVVYCASSLLLPRAAAVLSVSVSLRICVVLLRKSSMPVCACDAALMCNVISCDCTRSVT
jgi:hypothetical protein